MSQIVCDNLVKIYKVADLEVVALQGLDLVVEGGVLIALVGATGSGKSTLQNILGGLDTPTAGKAEVAGFDLAALGTRERTNYRRRVVGFIWQQTARNLFPYLTAAENVELPLVLDGQRDKAGGVAAMLDRVGLGDRADHLPGELSGGEMQRAAIARALVAGPELILADEPTGNLDSTNGAIVLDVLAEQVAEAGAALLMVTHDESAAERADRVLHLRDGHLE